ncbi:hypothetical protein [Pelagibius sp.]|uniref:hypothetical protein n=1 Tax=Pelagibius sp. TaxID=1931238 RepID=UPI0026347DA2|nr:hypothetical protein [Pelagibius sp.]
MSSGELEALLQAEVQRPVAPSVAQPIAAIAEAAKQRHGAVAATLFYGSCLGRETLEGRIADLYLLVDSYADAHRSGLSALANRALPPNVYYLETRDAEGAVVRAKYAVCSLADFAAGAGGRWFHPYLWARFAQPCRLVYSRDADVRAQVTSVLARSVLHTVTEGAALMQSNFTVEDLWTATFRETYRTELRAEGPDRVKDLYDANRQYFEALGKAALFALKVPAVAGQDGAPAGPTRYACPAPGGSPQSKWRLRRVQGKLLSVLRLMKAAFTFADGPDYLAWKIERHSGVAVTLTPWQRRHPLLAAPLLFWQLYRRGAFR